MGAGSFGALREWAEPWWRTPEDPCCRLNAKTDVHAYVRVDTCLAAVRPACLLSRVAIWLYALCLVLCILIHFHIHNLASWARMQQLLAFCGSQNQQRQDVIAQDQNSRKNSQDLSTAS